MKLLGERALLLVGCLVAGGVGGQIASRRDWTAEAVAAGAAWATVVVAIVAAALVLRQIREAQQLRLEQAKPYVIAFMEPDETNPMLVNIVVQNFGATAAVDVRVVVTPTPQRSSHAGVPVEDVWLPEVIPTLVPGQRWQTWWDVSSERADSEPAVVSRHDVSISYKDPNRPPDADPELVVAVLDWDQYSGRRWAQTYGTHHAAKALRNIEKRLRNHKLPMSGATVWVRDADRHDAEKDKEFADYIASEKAKDAAAKGQARRDDVTGRNREVPGV